MERNSDVVKNDLEHLSHDDARREQSEGDLEHVVEDFMSESDKAAIRSLNDSFVSTETMCCKSLLDILKRGIMTNWWMKCPPVNGNSHFENLQSTNWNSLRFKNPPTEDSKIGWRVEFRPMDIQLTDYENTALTVMVGMIANINN